LQHIFARNDIGERACNGGNQLLNYDPHWKDYVFFHEFFHADSGAGLGACHQTGWTGLIAKLIHDTGVNCRLPQTPRTPSTHASHYFDEIFTKIPNSRPKPFTGRRASSRSIGFRSDVSDDQSDDWTGVDDNGEDRQAQEREKDDKYVLDYVANQLKRVQTNGSVFDDEDEEDEFAVKAD